MKLTAAFSPTLRVDALGALAALALTAGAAILAFGPKLLSHAPTRAQQQAELDARRKEALDIERLAEAAHKNLADLQSQSAVAVQLRPANTINQRLGDMAAIAEPLNIAILQLSPGPAAPPPATPAAGSPAPSEPKATIVPIKLAGTGTYPDIARFIHALHDKFRDTALSSLKLTAQPDPKQSEKQIAAFSIDLAWYAAPAASDGAPPKP